ncbi:MAG: hypothetical protein ACTIAP_11550, partial [Cellulosimicrobium funkei]
GGQAGGGGRSVVLHQDKPTEREDDDHQGDPRFTPEDPGRDGAAPVTILPCPPRQFVIPADDFPRRARTS